MRERLANMPWRAILGSSWVKVIGGGLGGMVFSIVWSFAPDAFWVHDNRQALNTLLTSQPLIQRDIADLKEGLKELNLTIKENTLALQKHERPQRLILEKK